jgi:DNA invertase Pin-like site-specific DNA recombinase
MNPSNPKIKPDHLQRQAYVYIRQSTLHQVQHNLESQRRQYALRERAIDLGWFPSTVVVIDDDQGLSGQDTERPGFQRLLQAISSGQVGAVFCIEVSRLSRRSSAWHGLVELCAWQGTLIVEEENVYDPNLSDDRFHLGIRGLMYENELDTLRKRMHKSRIEKARRGELRFHPPTGLLCDKGGTFRLDPDDQVQEAIRLLFRQFQRLGNAFAVTRYFDDHKILFPTRHFGGVRDGELKWKSLSHQRTLGVLHNPLYAGAYAYGRRTFSRQRKPREKWSQREVLLPQEEWIGLIWDAFPSYISRDEFDANERRLAANNPHRAGRGAARSGAALLGGLGICGLCGRSMCVEYDGTYGQYVTYICYPHRKRGRAHACQRVRGENIDQSVVQRVLEALTPAEIDLSLRVLDEIDQQTASLRRQWELRLERERYETDLAQRRYLLVEPENRLVTRSLELEWEKRLQALAQAEQEYADAQKATPLALSEREREQLLALSHDLPALWQAETTTVVERKEILRLLIADVTLTSQDANVLVQLRWITNEVEEWIVPTPRRRCIRTDPAVIERIRELSPTHTDAEIAVCLNEAGMLTVHEKVFNASRVSGLRRIHQIVKVRRN